MPILIPEKPSRINAVILERLDKFIEENYIPPESIPKGTVFLPERNNVEIPLPRNRDRGKHYGY
jgi:hypothetical protein